MSETWNHGAVRRYFAGLVEADSHTVEHAAYRVGEGAAHVVAAHLLKGPFDPSADPDLSKRAKRSIGRGTWAFVTHEEWVGEYAVTYFNGDPVADEAEARMCYDGFAHLMEDKRV